MIALDIDLLLSHLFKPIISHQKEGTKHRNLNKEKKKSSDAPRDVPRISGNSQLFQTSVQQDFYL
ncbi:hypothetical protein HMPREF9378_1168 [Streptococcus sanguinis SK1 = NCTC 7863]|jgi:hypothetical protein|uniref:Uncharacterized protein n=1 Tax=Streptococcus sanguinis SK408 TaxID=888818 RepID=F2CE89_STRSA|nr:hypothetical protein HMPREF9392_0723 [Streptococcus sanguinis SK678]EGF08067.1 hypothetical protein HMPREF9378_1168 [Streptococcus sanguinis SK1 = NCTC 7863]EGF18877.1 hypothetical protein HMPREF9391_1266 [Streptococcus sanguinis SK408]EGF20816.1 hypothetical protein HMPREF9395_1756 [Streptococcus sanguinis SK1058]PLA63529.1 hypothetical protein CYK23_11280 [Streptococcus salivarius]